VTDPSKDPDVFFGHLRALDSPPAGARELVRARLTEKLGNVWNEQPGSSSAPGRVASRPLRAFGTCLVIGLVGGALTVGTWQLRGSSSSGSEPITRSASVASPTPKDDGIAPPASPTAVASPQEEQCRPEPALFIAPVEALPAAKTKRESGKAAPVAAVAPAAAAPKPRGAVDQDASSLAEEARLVRSAHASLRRGDAAEALAHLDEHERRFQNGVLRQERRGERVLCLCALGRRQEATELARSFLREEPASSLADRVRASCGGEP
jgi:hypothetical protein